MGWRTCMYLRCGLSPHLPLCALLCGNDAVTGETCNYSYVSVPAGTSYLYIHTYVCVIFHSASSFVMLK